MSFNKKINYNVVTYYKIKIIRFSREILLKSIRDIAVFILRTILVRLFYSTCEWIKPTIIISLQIWNRCRSNSTRRSSLVPTLYVLLKIWIDAINSKNFVVMCIIRHDGIKRNHLLHLYNSEYVSFRGLLFNFWEFIYIYDKHAYHIHKDLLIIQK